MWLEQRERGAETGEARRGPAEVQGPVGCREDLGFGPKEVEALQGGMQTGRT